MVNIRHNLLAYLFLCVCNIVLEIGMSTSLRGSDHSSHSLGTRMVGYQKHFSMTRKVSRKVLR